MKTTLCTLYNSLYLDKGLVLFDSLKDCASDFELYVLCMDDKCFEVLSNQNEERLIPIRLSDVENDKMLIAKSNRSMAEYCWTCSSRLIQYIFEEFAPQCCTYIDADMYFYHDPQILVDEMLEAGKSVMMVPHRFSEREIHLEKKVGKYCVEFNCFKNDKSGNSVLLYWHNQCLDCCSCMDDGIHWGDQKYMDEWELMYPDIVHVCNHFGAGVASWNIDSYKDLNKTDYTIYHKESKKRFETIFFHFHSLKYYSRKEIDTCVVAYNQNIDYELVDGFFVDYLNRLEQKKKYLETDYGIKTLLKRHPSVKGFSLKRFLLRNSLVRAILRARKKTNSQYVIILK